MSIPRKPVPSNTFRAETPLKVEAQLPQPYQPSRYARVFTNWWLWEIASWLLSTAALISIAIVLRVYDGKSLPRWPLGLTLNAFISLFSTLSRIAMIYPVAEALGQLKWIWIKRGAKMMDLDAFDGASRGPRGALDLLYRTRFSHLGSLGAVVVILAIALDPFYQQVVAYPERDVAVGNATLPQVITWSSYTGVQGDNNAVTDGSMLGAISSAIQGGKELSSAIAPSCDGIKCTWEDFDTLAMCWTCEDLTASLRHQCVNNTQTQEDFTIASYKYGYHCGYTTAEELSTYDPTPDLYGYTTVDELYTYYDPTGESYGAIMTVISNDTFVRDKPYPLLRFDAAISAGGYQGLNQTPIATRCRLDYCVKKVSASYEGGALTEHVTSSTNLNFVDTTEYDGWILEQRNRTFHVPEDPVLRDYLLESLQGRAYVKPDEPDIAWGTIYMPTQSAVLSDDAIIASLQGVYKSFSELPHNISVLTARLASAMSNNIRTHKGNGTLQVIGTVWTTETHVQVRWLWLLYPIILQALSLIFLIWTMIRQSRSNIAIWKSSSLAALFHTEVFPRGEGCALLQRSLMEEKAARINVVLSEKEGGWHIRSENVDGIVPTSRP